MSFARATLRYELLLSAVEDRTGVFEWWDPAIDEFPHSWQTEARISLTEATLIALLEEGLIRFWRGHYLEPDDEHSSIPSSEVAELLQLWRSWQPQDVRLYFEATPIGELKLSEQSSARPDADG